MVISVSTSNVRFMVWSCMTRTNWRVVRESTHSASTTRGWSAIFVSNDIPAALLIFFTTQGSAVSLNHPTYIKVCNNFKMPVKWKIQKSEIKHTRIGFICTTFHFTRPTWTTSAGVICTVLVTIHVVTEFLSVATTHARTISFAQSTRFAKEVRSPQYHRSKELIQDKHVKESFIPAWASVAPHFFIPYGHGQPPSVIKAQDSASPVYSEKQVSSMRSSQHTEVQYPASISQQVQEQMIEA